VKKFVSAFARIVLLDAGPLVAIIDRTDRHHAWARQVLPKLGGRFITCEAVLAETLHILGNSPDGIEALRIFLHRMDIVPAINGRVEAVFARLRSFAPQMDLADACLVVLAGANSDSIVVTTDTRDFSIYRVPFLSPEGLFANIAARVP